MIIHNKKGSANKGGQPSQDRRTKEQQIEEIMQGILRELETEAKAGYLFKTDAANAIAFYQSEAGRYELVDMIETILESHPANKPLDCDYNLLAYYVLITFINEAEACDDDEEDEDDEEEDDYEHDEE